MNHEWALVHFRTNTETRCGKTCYVVHWISAASSSVVFASEVKAHLSHSRVGQYHKQTYSHYTRITNFKSRTTVIEGATAPRVNFTTASTW